MNYSNGMNKRKTSSVSSSKQKGLGGHAAPDLFNPAKTVDGMIQVDSGLAGVDSALASRAKVHDTLHARLAHVDESQNSDKYYILQVIVDEKRKKQKTKQHGRIMTKGSNTHQYYLFSRWGRTGTGGRAKLDGPMQDEDAVERAFCNVFESKVGFVWSNAIPGMEPIDGKYEYLQNNIVRCTINNLKTASWFYYLHNDPLGKPSYWYAYDWDNSEEVEELYLDFMSSNQAKRLSTRFVYSESSGFTYRIDLSKMNQKNTQTGKVRPIRRTLLSF